MGTAVGYSSILMSENMPKDCRIVTIENYDKRIQAAHNNIKRAGKEDCIQLIEGDALKVLKELEGPYDFIFMDAAKGQYINYLPDILRLMLLAGFLYLIIFFRKANLWNQDMLLQDVTGLFIQE